jgi:hypothetical protein
MVRFAGALRVFADKREIALSSVLNRSIPILLTCLLMGELNLLSLKT